MKNDKLLRLREQLDDKAMEMITLLNSIAKLNGVENTYKEYKDEVNLFFGNKINFEVEVWGHSLEKRGDFIVR